MSLAAVPVGAQKLPSAALRRFAWAVLAYFIAVILWGALVRATGSGAGCGDHWPLCNGTVMQHSPRVDTMIEFTHRMTSGISFFSAVGLLVWTFAGTVRGHLARSASVATVAFTLIEAVLGALLVKLGLTAQSQSPLRAPYLALHLANTLLLLAALTLTAHFLSRTHGFTRSTIRVVAPAGGLIGVVVVLVVGVTGSLAALGDTLFPATSLGAALAQDFSATSGWLVRWRWTSSYHRLRGERLSDLARGARLAAFGPLGQSRPLGAGPDPACRPVSAGPARRGDASAGLAADFAPARSRCPVGCARGAHSEADAGTGKTGNRDQGIGIRTLTFYGGSVLFCSLIPCFYFTTTPAAG